MSHVGDSLRPRGGPGVLPLQHHSYKDEGLELDERRLVAAMRVVAAEPKTNIAVYEEGSVGDLIGAMLWKANTRLAPAWSWVFPSVVPSAGVATTEASGRGGTSTPQPTGGPSGEITAEQRGASHPGGVVTPTGIKFRGKVFAAPAGSFAINTEVQTMASSGGGGGGGGAVLAAGNNVNQPSQDDAKNKAKNSEATNPQNIRGEWAFMGGAWINPQFIGGAFDPKTGKPVGALNQGLFGIGGQPWLNPWNNAGGIWNPKANQGKGQWIPDVFGVGVQALYPTWVFPPAPISANAKKKKPTKPDENLNDSWNQETEATQISGGLYPTRADFTADKSFQKIQPIHPEGWPEFPKGFYGLTVMATDVDRQREIFMPCDPRLVAANINGPWSAGSIVSDMASGGHLATDRGARLHSILRVIKAPKGAHGTLKGNKGRKKPVNALAIQLGPSGQGDTFGGLVCDLPTGKEGKIADGPGRVLAALSVLHGGPLDVGHYGDAHEIGTDADSNPINSCHISTEALFKEQGDVFKDGPLRFETYHRAGDLDFPVAVHLGFDFGAEDWAWWTTDYIYTPAKKRDPEPTPEPEPVPGPGGTVVPVPGREPRHPGEIPPPHGPPGGGNNPGPGTVYPGRSSGRYLSVGAAILKELTMTAQAYRPQAIHKGATEFRYGGPPDLGAVAKLDATVPLTLRSEAYGQAYGGNTQAWQYTQKPGQSRWLGGTGNGGMVYMPPEVDMSDLGTTFAPPGLALSTSYVVTAPLVCRAAGTPHLSTGAIATGYSWGADAVGDLVYSSHDANGVGTERIKLLTGGTFEINNHAEISVSDASAAQSVTTTPGTTTGWTTNGQSSNMTPDQANKKITCVRTGTYLVGFQCSFTGEAGRRYEVHLRIDGAEQAQGCHRYLSGADIGSMSITALLPLVAGEDLEAYVEVDNGTRDFTPADMQMTAVRVL